MKRMTGTLAGLLAAVVIAAGAGAQTQDDDMAAVGAQVAAMPGYGARSLAGFADGPFDALGRKDREIVKAICEAQLNSRRDRAGEKLLGRDAIARMKAGTTWRGVFAKLRKAGFVTGRSLGEALRAYRRGSELAPSYTIISTGSGRKIVVAPPRASGLALKPKPVLTMGVGSTSRSLVAKAAHPGRAVVILASGGVISGSLTPSGPARDDRGVDRAKDLALFLPPRPPARRRK